ncbi:MAG: hypothetical protein LUD50_00030 [Clostridia bacterium]|nr:hypothetical protein [Clostridia bacterium]
MDRADQLRMTPKIERLNYDMNIPTALAIVHEIGKRKGPDFRIDADNQFAYENIVKWCLGRSDAQSLNPENVKQRVAADLKKGIYLAGPTGSGKTWCLAVMRDFCSVLGLRVRIRGDMERLAWDTYHISSVRNFYLQDGNVRELCKTPVLCINDLGCEPDESVYMGNRGNPAKELIEYRGDQDDAITLFTSNLNLCDPKGRLLEKYGDRVVSRLYEMCNYYQIKGGDRRRPQKTQDHGSERNKA